MLKLSKKLLAILVAGGWLLPDIAMAYPTYAMAARCESVLWTGHFNVQALSPLAVSRSRMGAFVNWASIEVFRAACVLLQKPPQGRPSAKPGYVGQGQSRLFSGSLIRYMNPLSPAQADQIQKALSHLESIHRDPPSTSTDNDLMLLDDILRIPFWRYLRQSYPTGRVGTFAAIRRSDEDYLLAASSSRGLIISNEVLAELKSSPDLLAELLFHEGWNMLEPESGKRDHQERYRGVQRRLFGEENRLGPRLRAALSMAKPIGWTPEAWEGVDLRAAWAGLLHPAIIAYDQAIKRVVNPNGRFGVALYLGARMDVSNLLLTTDAPKSIFVDTAYEGISLSLLQKYFPGGPDIVQNLIGLEYAETKFKYAAAESVRPRSPEEVVVELFTELTAVGVDPAKVVPSLSNSGRLQIRFPWSRESGSERTYEITFVSADVDEITGSDYQDIWGEPILWVFQRAGHVLARGYLEERPTYIERIAVRVSHEAFFITDDTAFFPEKAGTDAFQDLSGHFPLKDGWREIDVPDQDTFVEKVLTIHKPGRVRYVEEPGRKVLHDSSFYGWFFHVRQRILPPSRGHSTHGIMGIDSPLGLARTFLASLLTQLRERLLLPAQKARVFQRAA